MGTILIVDWLGRGGIAQTSDEWARAARLAGHEPVVVTRRGRPLTSTTSAIVRDAGGGNRFLDEIAVVRETLRALEETAPSAVVVQNYVVPEIETTVLLAARRRGVRSVLVAHEPTLPWRPALRRQALASELRAADVVVCHSRFVSGLVKRTRTKLPPVLLPLPVVTFLVELAASGSSVLPPDPRPTALLFGHLHRGYKGAARFLELAAEGVPGWRLAAVGKEAPVGPGVVTVQRFVSDAELASTIAACSVTALPYDRAAQSGAVSLAQSLGSVVVTTAVGGLPEQVEPGTGILLPADAGTAQWKDALAALGEEELAELSARAREASERRRTAFEEGVSQLLADR
jgi:glycosyltransferase involved in cell wall biosynthesis